MELQHSRKRGSFARKSTTTTKITTQNEKSPTRERSSEVVIHKSRSKRKKAKPIKRPAKSSHVLKDIRYYQNMTNCLIPRAPFARVIREVLNEYTDGFRISIDALTALQESTEIYLTQLFEDAYQCCLYRGRVTLAVKDIEIVRYLRGVKDAGCK